MQCWREGGRNGRKGRKGGGERVGNFQTQINFSLCKSPPAESSKLRLHKVCCCCCCFQGKSTGHPAEASRASKDLHTLEPLKPRPDPLVCDRNLANEGLGGLLPWDNRVWSSLGSLDSIDLAGNNVSGYIPPQIIQDLGLRTLNLANNSLQGPLPSTLPGSMQAVATSSNQLTGLQFTIPPPSSNTPLLPSALLSSMQAVATNTNQLTGLQNITPPPPITQ